MTREAIGIGDNEELAKLNALKQLGLTSDKNVEFRVIKKAEKKILGFFGGSQAKVRAIVETPDEMEEVLEKIQKKDIADEFLDSALVENVENTVQNSEVTAAVSDMENADEQISYHRVENTAESVSDYDCAKEAKAYVERVLKAMGLEDINVEMNETADSAEIILSGEQVGAVIGRRGDTLDALQYLAGLVANHVGNTYFRVTINTGNYREKREKTLEGLGRKMAFKAIKSGRNQILEPMNPYERRIIHTAVQKVNGAISWSEGEVTKRHVVIGVDPEYKKNYRKPYNKNGGKRPYNSNSYYNKKKPYNSRKTNYSDSVTTQRQPKNEGGNLSLYGKVELKNS